MTNQETVDQLRKIHDAIVEGLASAGINREIELLKFHIKEAVRYSLMLHNVLKKGEQIQSIDAAFFKDHPIFSVNTGVNKYYAPESFVRKDLIHQHGIAGLPVIWDGEIVYAIFTYNDAYSGTGRSFEESLNIHFNLNKTEVANEHSN